MRSISADYSQYPQQKVSLVIVFHIFLSLIVSSSRRIIVLPFDARFDLVSQ